MKIHVFGGELGFLTPLIHKLSTGYGVTTTYCSDFVKPTFPDVDVVWFEWADNNVAAFTKKYVDYLKNKKVIVRLHAVEAYTGWFLNINWGVVDNLIVVSEHIRDKVVPHIPTNVKVSVIPNAIDLDKWTYKCRSSGPNIAIVGHFQADKGALLLPHIMSLLSSSQFHVAGQVRINVKDRPGEYFFHAIEPFSHRIRFYGHVADMDKWYDENDINYLLCPSLAESFCLSIGEAMAKGIKPIVNDFLGSRKLWISDTIYSTIDKIPEILSSKYDSKVYRDWVSQKYDINVVVDKIKELIK
jgi:glycosyltransferase involved in cell wall biosynthesis